MNNISKKDFQISVCMITYNHAKYIEKAKRRGKFGWSVGKDLQISPHIRAACPAALYWTGKGRKTPKIRFRKGCVVHKKKLQNIPTGYVDK